MWKEKVINWKKKAILQKKSQETRDIVHSSDGIGGVGVGCGSSPELQNVMDLVDKYVQKKWEMGKNMQFC